MLQETIGTELLIAIVVGGLMIFGLGLWIDRILTVLGSHAQVIQTNSTRSEQLQEELSRLRAELEKHGINVSTMPAPQVEEDHTQNVSRSL